MDPFLFRRLAKETAPLAEIAYLHVMGEALLHPEFPSLMETALELADNELMMERVEVEIPTDNVGALKLCKAAGFKVEGIAKDWMRNPDGHFVDAYLMAHCRNAK